MSEMSGRSWRLCTAAAAPAAALCGCSTATPTRRAASRSATFISSCPLQPRPKEAKAARQCPGERPVAIGAGVARRLGCDLFPPAAWAIEPRLFLDFEPRAQRAQDDDP